MPDPTNKQTTSTLSLRQKWKQDTLASLYRHFNVTENIDLINLEHFKLTATPKTGTIIFEFYNHDKCISLIKQTVKYFAPKISKKVKALCNEKLGIDKTLPASELFLKAKTKLKCELHSDIEMETVLLLEFSP